MLVLIISLNQCKKNDEIIADQCYVQFFDEDLVEEPALHKIAQNGFGHIRVGEGEMGMILWKFDSGALQIIPDYEYLKNGDILLFVDECNLTQFFKNIKKYKYSLKMFGKIGLFVNDPFKAKKYIKNFTVIRDQHIVQIDIKTGNKKILDEVEKDNIQIPEKEKD